jgi:hypothetical protein
MINGLQRGQRARAPIRSRPGSWMAYFSARLVEGSPLMDLTGQSGPDPASSPSMPSMNRTSELPCRRLPMWLGTDAAQEGRARFR